MTAYHWIAVAVLPLLTMGAGAQEKTTLQKTLLSCNGKQYALFSSSTLKDSQVTQKLKLFCTSEAAEDLSVESDQDEIQGDPQTCTENQDEEETQVCLTEIKKRLEVEDGSDVMNKPGELEKIASEKDGIKTEPETGADDAKPTEDSGTGNTGGEGEENEQQEDGETEDDSGGEGEEEKPTEEPGNEPEPTEPAEDDKLKQCEKLEEEPFECVSGTGEEQTKTLYEAVHCQVEGKDSWTDNHGHKHEQEWVDIFFAFCSKSLFDDATKSAYDCWEENSPETLSCHQQYLQKKNGPIYYDHQSPHPPAYPQPPAGTRYVQPPAGERYDQPPYYGNGEGVYDDESWLNSPAFRGYGESY